MGKKKQALNKTTNSQQRAQEKWKTLDGATQSGFPVHRKLRDDLAAHGLKIREVKADGNCFFRAVADQLEVMVILQRPSSQGCIRDAPFDDIAALLQGASGDHMQLRQKVVTFMRQHKADFEPYMEDDEGFDKYCQRMAQACTLAQQGLPTAAHPAHAGA